LAQRRFSEVSVFFLRALLIGVTGAISAGECLIDPLQRNVFFLSYGSDGSNRMSSAGVVVPHASRGVCLDQLQALYTAFVASEWLSQRSQQHNSEQHDAILAGTCFAMNTSKGEENLYALNELVVQPVTASDGYARRSIPESLLRISSIPSVPYRCCSYAELVNPNGMAIDTFVSHWWGHSFQKTVNSLWKFARKACSAHGDKEQPGHLVLWICLFALNQHSPAVEVGSNLEESPFSLALASARMGGIMIIDEDIQPMKRIWCLFEIQRAGELQRPLELVTEDGLALDGTVDSQLQPMIEKLGEALVHVSAYDAIASVEKDKWIIWHRIVSPEHRCIPFGVFQRQVVEKDWFRDFDTNLSAILATPLLQSVLLRDRLHDEDINMALKYIWLGGKCQPADLEKLAPRVLSAVMAARFADACSAVHVAAHFGHADVAKWLVEHRANCNTRHGQGFTPLQVASFHGHAHVASLLLASAANCEESTVGRLTPLHLASSGGHVAVVELLVARLADAETQSHNGSTPIHFASRGGHTSVVRCLLRHAADHEAMDSRGSSPLHVAAFFGHTLTVRCLLEHGCDVEVPDRTGSTPLHQAALGGHAAVASCLIEGKADLQMTDLQGRSAIDIARNEGFDHVFESVRIEKPSVLILDLSQAKP